MGNLGATLKRFLGNKNTVTILAILAGVIVLWYGYTYRVNQAITTISVPYAVERINPGSKIETDNIDYKNVTSSSTRNSSIIANVGELNGKYVCTGNAVPKDGFFYREQVCDEKDLKNSILDNIPDGYTLFYLGVDSTSTYGNAIMAGSYIDLYILGQDDNNRVMYGPFIESIQVLAVWDSSHKDIDWDTTARDSAYLVFTVPNDIHNLLTIAGEIRSIEIKPVLRSTSYSEKPGETKIVSTAFENFINSKYSPTR